MRSLLDALSEAAPDIALLRAEIEAGNVRPELDITPFILDAARLIMSARDLAAKEGSTAAKVVAEMLDDIDLLDGAVAPLTQALVRHLMPGGKQAPAAKISAFLKRYVDEARKAGRTGDALFEQPGPLDVLKAIDSRAFGDLVETGMARIADPATPSIDTEVIPDGAFSKGAASPEAQVADDLAFDQLVEAQRSAIRANASALGDVADDMEFAIEGGEVITLRDFWKIWTRTKRRKPSSMRAHLGGHANGEPARLHPTGDGCQRIGHDARPRDPVRIRSAGGAVRTGDATSPS